MATLAQIARSLLRKFFVFLVVGFIAKPTTLLANQLIELKEEIRKSESQIIGLKKGTEKQILFFDEKNPKRTPLSVIYLHGFSASPQEISPLPQKLAKKLKANLYLHRYKGHGIKGMDGLKNVDHYDWIRETHRAYEIGRTLGNEVIVLATSTGASLALIESLNNSRSVKTLLFISPNFGLKNSFSPLLLWPGGSLLARLVFGEYREWKPQSKEQEYFWTTKYPSKTLIELMRAVDFSVHLSNSNLSIPIFVMRNLNDTIVDVEKIREVLFINNGHTNRKICCDELPSENDHVLAGDILSPSGTDFLLEKIFTFLKENTEIKN
ncbi:MAG: hypothetical protein M9962_09050 [Oligoflexia bacterium]|nr:hypothetical protein [Oligoflexia bacterium]